MAEMEPGTRVTRSLRPRGEVPRLLLHSARTLFAAKGYNGTSTREIAEAAGVSKALLFRHFGSKAALFEQAVLEPFADFVARYVGVWEAGPPYVRSPEEMGHDFVEGLYGLFLENRELVIALLAAVTLDDEMSDAGQQPAAALEQLIRRLEEVARVETTGRGYQHLDIPVMIRGCIALVIGMALLDDWLFPPQRRRPSRRRIVNEVAALLVHGMVDRPEPSWARPPSQRPPTRRRAD